MIVLIGESASGKSTIEKELVNEFGYKKITSYTTRSPRTGEVDGIDYNFVSDSEFEKLKNSNFFAETATYNAWNYGTPKNECIDNAILVATPHGLRQLKKNLDVDIISFYIKVDRRDRLIRILKRGDNIEEAYRRSISDVFQYDGIEDEVDYVIDNIDNIGILPAINNIKKIILNHNTEPYYKKKKLFVDFDCTLANTIKAITDLYNEDYCYYKDYKKVNWENIETWNFLELSVAKPEAINLYFNQQRFFDKVELFPNAKEVMDMLSSKYDISIVSHGYSPNLIAKEKYCNKMFPYANFIGVNLKEHSDKSSIDMSYGIFIDDRADNLNSSNAEKKICFGDAYEWNKGWDNNSVTNHFNAFNWIDVKELLN